jgi:hypothetical protein
MPISHAEISRDMAALLDRADKNGRAHIVGISLSSLLLEFPPEERYRVLDETIQAFRRLLPGMADR